MAILKKGQFQTKEIELESVDGGIITIKKDISYKTIDEFNSKHKAIEQMNSKEKEAYNMGFLLLYILDWNLTDEKENKLPITIENLLELGIRDIQNISESIKNNMEKKSN